jgi:endonuclease/exonuclease/phosphatase family metal-dependent hydrolase
MKTRGNLFFDRRGQHHTTGVLFSIWILVSWLFAAQATAADTFTVATYNLENYLVAPQESRKAKPVEARARIQETLKTLNADVLALQEVGGKAALAELHDALKKEGLNYSQWEIIQGPDPVLNLAILSRYPIIARRPHPDESFLLNGRRFKVSRGFAEVDIRVNAHCTFTLITAHLKSRRPVPQADEGDLREQEGLRLREIIDARLAANPGLNLVIAGDLNDLKSSPSTRAVMGQGKTALVDLRPAELEDNAEEENGGNGSLRHVTWTYFYAREDTYSRIDFILTSRSMARKCYRKETQVLALPYWGEASDHRPVISSFFAGDRTNTTSE